MKSTYWVLHNYGAHEGWKIQAKAETMLAAVEAREADVTNGGGESVIVELVDLYDAYQRAGYERNRQIREPEA